jgi:hypothetical protein
MGGRHPRASQFDRCASVRRFAFIDAVSGLFLSFLSQHLQQSMVRAAPAVWSTLILSCANNHTEFIQWQVIR